MHAIMEGRFVLQVITHARSIIYVLSMLSNLVLNTCVFDVNLRLQTLSCVIQI